MKLCPTELCTGCAACVNACNRNALFFVADKEGFLRPSLRNDLCVECGACERACPVQCTQVWPTEEKRVYACWHKDAAVRSMSTSGGAFTAIAQKILENGGIVYGATLENVTRVVHKGIRATDQLKLFCGSKYVQSEIQFVFREIKVALQKGQQVLFSGTPCQVAGLYAYLQKRYEDFLVTVDIVCHGVPSPKIFNDYIQWLEQQYHSNVVDYQFRDKSIGWYLHSTKIHFASGKVLKEHFFKNPFFRGFLRNFFLRPSCYRCQYANINRPADITLADFWGHVTLQDDGCDRDDDKGISMVMVNSTKGNAIFEQAKVDLIVWERDLVHATNGNPALNAPFLEPVNRAEFWADYQKLPFSQLMKKYMKSEKLSEWWLWRYKREFYGRYIYCKMKSLLKRILRKMLSKRIIPKLKSLYK